MMNDVDSPAVDSKLVRRLIAGEFAVTAEITPPVAAGPQPLLDKAMMLKDCVDAVNVTDGASARVHMSSTASGAILAANGIEPVVQFTCRDRNRIALQGDLLGTAAERDAQLHRFATEVRPLLGHAPAAQHAAN